MNTVGLSGLSSGLLHSETFQSCVKSISGTISEFHTYSCSVVYQ